MSIAIASCPRCSESLDGTTLDGLCARCVALDFFGDDPELLSLRDVTPPGMALGSYEIIEEIGRGGMGVVYRARQTSLGRTVAVKTILRGMGTPEALARFRTEAAAAAGLRHPNIVAVHETGEEDGIHFFSMDLVDGPSLSARLRDGPLPAREAAALVEKIALAVAYAHENAVVHRDLKPSNVLLDVAGEPRVTDFGLAKRLGCGDDLTLSGQVLGSPGYLAPEQARGEGHKAGPLVDVYGLGAILYHTLTGRAPFVGEDAIVILRQVERNDPPSLRVLNPTIPAELEAIALKCVAREPERRYPSAAEVAADLRRWLEGRPVHAKPMSRIAKGARWMRRNPMLAGSGLAVFLALAAVAIVSTVSARRLERSRNDEAAQRRRAEAAQRAAEDSAENLRLNLYAADMPQVQRFLAAGDLHKARLLLEAHRPAAGQKDFRGWEWRRLWHEARGDELASRFSGRDGMTGLDISRDGTMLAMASIRVTVWDTATLTLQKSSPMGHINSVAFSPDGNLIYYTGARGPVMRWRWRDDGEPAMLLHEPRGFARVTVSPAGDLLAVGSGTRQGGEPDGVVSLYDASTGELRRALPESGGHAEFSPDGTLLVTGSHKGEVKLWDARSGELRHIFGNLPRTTALRFSADGRRIVASRHTGVCQILDVATGVARDGTPGYTGSVWNAALSPDGTRLATASLDQTLRLWDAESGRELAKFRGHLRGLGQIAWSPDGRILATGGADGTVKFWPTEPLPRPPDALKGNLPAHPFSKDGRFLLLAGSGGQVTLHEWPSLEVRGRTTIGYCLGFVAGTDQVLGSVLSTRGEKERSVQAWRIPDFQPGKVTALPGGEGDARRLFLSDDGRWITALTDSGDTRVWDLANNGRLTDLSRIADPVTSAFVLPDPPILLAGCAVFPHLRKFSLPDGEWRGMIQHNGGAPSRVLQVDGGKAIITSTGNTVVRKIDLATSSEAWSFAEFDGPVALSPDGQTLACAAGGVRLWNLATRREVARYDFDGKVTRMAFAPDGSALLLSDAVGTTRIWRAFELAEADTVETIPDTPAR